MFAPGRIRYTKEERIEMVKLYGDHACTAREVCDEFHRRHPDRPSPASSTVSRLIVKFNNTGSVTNQSYKWKTKPATGVEKTTAVLAAYEVCPVQGVRHVAQEGGISMKSVHRILKENDMYPYKIQLIHELERDDTERRLTFCDWATTQLDRNPEFAHYVIWSDEATFYLNGHVNRQDYRYWCKDNPHWAIESHTQRPQKLNVWCGIWDDLIIGPFFMRGNLTSDRYQELLQTEVFPTIQNQIDVNLPWFQQDGAPPHFGINVREYLDVVFPGKWIGRAGPVEWPPRSPDLTPLDYFLWGYLKSHAFANRPTSLEQLEENIRSVCNRIVENNLLERVLGGWDQRVRDCVAADGEQFEHRR
jgi:hypothetical protein